MRVGTILKSRPRLRIRTASVAICVALLQTLIWSGLAFVGSASAQNAAEVEVLEVGHTLPDSRAHLAARLAHGLPPDAVFFGEGPIHLRHLAGEGCKLHRLPEYFNLAGIGPGEQEEAVHQNCEPLALLAQ